MRSARRARAAARPCRSRRGPGRRRPPSAPTRPASSHHPRRVDVEAEPLDRGSGPRPLGPAVELAEPGVAALEAEVVGHVERSRSGRGSGARSADPASRAAAAEPMSKGWPATSAVGARVGTVVAGEGLHERRLAAAVGADDGVDLDRPRSVSETSVEGPLAGERLGHVGARSAGRRALSVMMPARAASKVRADHASPFRIPIARARTAGVPQTKPRAAPRVNRS